MKFNFKRVAAVAVTAGLALTLAACSNDSKTVVSYKGGKITQQQYYDEMKSSSSGKSTLANMIISKTLEQQYGSKVSQKKVNKEYNTYKKQYGSSFSSILSANGLTTKTFKENLRTNMLSEAALKDIKKVSTKQEKKWWASYQPKITVQHILVSKKSTAETVIKQLKKGTSFKTLAKKYSIDTTTKNKAGKLSAFDSTDTSLSSAFKKAAWKLDEGEYTTTPVKTSSGYEVIKVINKTKKGSFKDHKAFIDKQLYAEMAQSTSTMKSVIATVLKRANVKIKDNDLKNVLSSYISSSSSSSN
ncbi:peptidylprolyl isomerase PrsA [Lactobacillus corticis]|uniref:Foldase protein PrsA n=1 Tax=Lactobacillus corticis TaxID=2201249 RepID=A0A916QJ59_9LACO|nr:peptidylprolyl isomerase PrsA [Lactobacillus corticis]GFZ26652.1 peptidylprolyl isomerase [Lactobacillus corticis]